MSLGSDTVSDADGHKSVRKTAAMSGKLCSFTFTILRKYLQMVFFKPKYSQKLSQDQVKKRFDFCHQMHRCLQDEEFYVQKLYFRDEIKVYLDDALSKQKTVNSNFSSQTSTTESLFIRGKSRHGLESQAK